MLISFITNGLIALLLCFYIIKKKNVYSLFFALFLYITLHYSYSAVFTIFYPQDYRVMHKSTQIGAKLTGICFLLFTIIMLIWQNRKHIKNQLVGVNKYPNAGEGTPARRETDFESTVTALVESCRRHKRETGGRAASRRRLFGSATPSIARSAYRLENWKRARAPF